MYSKSTMKYACGIICVMLLIMEIASAAPAYSDLESNIRDLYELLMQKEALDERLGSHQLVRKSSRSPSLRLRFGRRSDPSVLPISTYMLAQDSVDHGDN